MLTVQYRSTLQPRVSEKQSRIIEHKRMAALARDERAALDAPRRPGLLARLTGRRPEVFEPEVTIWLDPLAGAPWTPVPEPVVAVAQPPQKVVA